MFNREVIEYRPISDQNQSTIADDGKGKIIW